MKYVACYPGLPRIYLKALLKIWGTTSHQNARVNAFFCIKELAIVTPVPFIEDCLKGIYLTYVRQSKDVGPVFYLYLFRKLITQLL